MDEVVTFTGTFTHPGENGNAIVVEGHALDHFLDEDRFAHARATEEADLATLHVRGEQVDNLEAGLEHLGFRLEFIEGGSLAVNRPAFLHVDLVGRNVERFAHDVEDVPAGNVPDRNGDGGTGIDNDGAAHQAVRRFHRDGAHHVIAQVLSHFQNHLLLDDASVTSGEGGRGFQGVIDIGKRVGRKFDVDDGANDLRNPAGCGQVRGLLL